MRRPCSRRAHDKALGENDRDVCVTEDFCRDRDFSITIDLSSGQKKKKNDPWGVGHPSLVSEPKYANYLELNVWYKHHSLVL